MKERRGGRWIPIEEGFPEVIENDDGEHSTVVLMAGKDGCIWLAHWDGEMWTSFPDSNIYFNKEYAEHWMKIPRRRKHAG